MRWTAGPEPAATEGLINRNEGETMQSTGILIKAAAFAAERHRHQRRKDAEASPYINHPIGLASVLVHEGGVDDVEVLCAALLHDTIEDTETTREELQAEFGDRIAAIVMEVTDDKTLPKAERKRLQIEHAAGASGQARLVKLADKICNLRDIVQAPPADWSVDRKQEYFDWARQVIAGVRGTNALLEESFDAAYAGLSGTPLSVRLPSHWPNAEAWARMLHDGCIELELFDHSASAEAATGSAFANIWRIRAEAKPALAAVLERDFETPAEGILAALKVHFPGFEAVQEWLHHSGIGVEQRRDRWR